MISMFYYSHVSFLKLSFISHAFEELQSIFSQDNRVVETVNIFNEVEKGTRMK